MDKTITVRLETWKKLTKMKVDLDAETIDETISKFFSLVQKFKLAGELKQL